MDPLLEQRLQVVAKRLAMLRLAWGLAAVWGIASIVGCLLLRGLQNGIPSPGNLVAWWLGATAVLALCVWVLTRLTVRDRTEVAKRIEQRFPSLDQRLITATGLRPQTSNGQLGFLQRSVVSEAISHDIRHRWASVVSGTQLSLAWLANLPLVIVCGAVGVGLWSSPPGDPKALLALNSSTLSPPSVSPGDTEVELGGSLIVTSRFPGAVPEQVTLVKQPQDSATSNEGERRQLMKRSLSDPIFAAYVVDIREPFRYAVEYDGERTEYFDVAVFEYPSLVRADAVIDYPQYVAAEKKTIVDTRRVSAPVGSEVTWQLHLNKPVKSAVLIPNKTASSKLPSDEAGPQTLEMELSPSAPLASLSMPVSESGSWNVTLVDTEGRENQLDITLRINAIPNGSPQIKLTSGGDVLVSPIEELTIAAELKDDFGIQRYGVGYQMAGGELIERSAPADSQASKQIAATELINFEDFSPEPGQLLSYYMWAEDVDVSGEVRRTVSDIFFAEVRPFEEIYRQGQQPTADQQQNQQQQQGGQQGDQQTQELLELQKQIMVATWNVMRSTVRDELPARATDDLLLLVASQSDAINLLTEKAAEATAPGAEQLIEAANSHMLDAVKHFTDASKDRQKKSLNSALGAAQAAYQALLQMQSREHEVVRQQNQSSSSSSSSSRQQQIDQLQLQNQENRYQNERLAQTEEERQQGEMRQVVSRLRELAARQEDINKQLREIEAALQAADTEEQRRELEQQLQRLREQQQQMLQDSDELMERMSEQNNEQLQETQQQMEETRQNLQESSESLQQGNTSQAISAGTRAAEQLQQMQDEVRQQVANQFTEQVQQMRDQARELEQRQREIAENLGEKQSQPTPGLRDTESEQSTAEQLQQQRAELETLFQEMQTTIEQSEEAEPLLAQKLYEGYRRAQEEKLEEQLERTEMLLERNLTQQAVPEVEKSLKDMTNLRNDIDAAASSVLGSEVDALKRALNQLDDLSNELDQEIASATGQELQELQNEGSRDRIARALADSSERRDAERAQQQPDQQQQPNQQQPNQQQPAADRGEQPEQPAAEPGSGEGQGAESQQDRAQQQQPSQQPGQQPGQQPQDGQPQDGQQQDGQRPGQQPGQQQPGQGAQGSSGENAGTEQPSGEQPTPQASRGERPSLRGGESTQPRSGQQPSGQPRPGLRGGASGDREAEPQEGFGGDWNSADYSPGTSPETAPLTGEGYVEWSDRLRDVEELVPDSELRWQATQIRQRAREVRAELNKHAADPQWDEVEEMIAKPLRELKRKVADELIRRAAERTEIVPVDRDPVPSNFSRSVQTYYENLGSGR